MMESTNPVEEKVTNEVEVTDSSSTKRRREEKIRKRDPKAWDNINKSVAALSEMEKFNAVAKKYSELYDEFRKASQNCQSLEKTCTLLQKEKEHIRSEQAKSILARSRLENLCRELQKQNKQIKEENIAKIKEEEERRREVAGKFQKTLDEVTSMMNENREKNFKLRDDNIDMSKKISELYSEFQKREEDIKRMAKQMELEKQLAKATVTKLEFELKAEKEIWLKERSILQGNLEQSENRNKQLLENTKNMEEHLSIYKGQYEDFETTLDKSNKIFDNCKSEMVKMSKQIVMLEKEVTNWKSKWQVSATSLIELSTAKQTQDIHLAAADKKIEQLQKLCRQLQVDRGAFLKLLKANGIEPISQVCVESVEKPPTPKERELAILKDSLRMLQDQLRQSLNSAGETSDSCDNSHNKTEFSEGITKECDDMQADVAKGAGLQEPILTASECNEDIQQDIGESDGSTELVEQQSSQVTNINEPVLEDKDKITNENTISNEDVDEITEGSVNTDLDTDILKKSIAENVLIDEGESIEAVLEDINKTNSDTQQNDTESNVNLVALNGPVNVASPDEDCTEKQGENKNERDESGGVLIKIKFSSDGSDHEAIQSLINSCAETKESSDSVECNELKTADCCQDKKQNDGE